MSLEEFISEAKEQDNIDIDGLKSSDSTPITDIKDSEETIDVTDRVECYEKGKAFQCDCGQDLGVKLEVGTVKCASCSKLLIDEKAPREPNKMDRGNNDENTQGDANIEAFLS